MTVRKHLFQFLNGAIKTKTIPRPRGCSFLQFLYGALQTSNRFSLGGINCLVSIPIWYDSHFRTKCRDIRQP